MHYKVEVQDGKIWFTKMTQEESKSSDEKKESTISDERKELHELFSHKNYTLYKTEVLRLRVMCLQHDLDLNQAFKRIR